jgi:hypothetical protein
MPKVLLYISSLIFLFNFSLNLAARKTKVLAATNEVKEVYSPSLSEEKLFWENFQAINPTYRDGFLELASIEAELQNKRGALKFINLARKIDPNSTLILEVEQECFR